MLLDCKTDTTIVSLRGKLSEQSAVHAYFLFGPYLEDVSAKGYDVTQKQGSTQPVTQVETFFYGTI